MHASRLKANPQPSSTRTYLHKINSPHVYLLFSRPFRLWLYMLLYHWLRPFESWFKRSICHMSWYLFTSSSRSDANICTSYILDKPREQREESTSISILLMTRKRRLNIASHETLPAKSPKSKKKKTTLMKRRYVKHRGGLSQHELFSDVEQKIYIVNDGWMTLQSNDNNTEDVIPTSVLSWGSLWLCMCDDSWWTLAFLTLFVNCCQNIPKEHFQDTF